MPRMAIKKLPEDFVVTEQLSAAWQAAVTSRPATFAVYLLRKRSLSTPEAAAALARKLNLRPGDLAYAGLKDKQAVTAQHVTIATDPRRPLPPKIETLDWSAHRLGYVAEPITSAAIDSNHFDIIIRTLTLKDLTEITAAAQLLAIPQPLTPNPRSPSLLIVNYFGEQRFGSTRSGNSEDPGHLARLLIRGQFEEALRLIIATPHRNDHTDTKIFKRTVAEHWGDWREILPSLPDVPEKEAVHHLAGRPTNFAGAFAKLPYLDQQMIVDAYQSWLWNRIARQFITDIIAPSSLITAQDKFGDLIFPHAAAVPRELADLDLPILGENSELRDPWKSAAEKVLDEEKLTTADLRIPGLPRPAFRQVPRRLFVPATDFKMDPAQPDELQPKAKRYKLAVHFTLPRGSYATVALRAIGE